MWVIKKPELGPLFQSLVFKGGSGVNSDRTVYADR